MSELTIQITEEFEPFMQPSRYKVAYGGRGSGKSWSIAQLLIMQAYQTKTRILCAREMQRSIQDSVIQILADTIERMGLDPFFEVQKTQILGRNGSRFIFEGLKSNITKIKSMEGIDRVWVEEAEKVSSTSWDTLIPTIRKNNSEIWLSFNPSDELDPTYQRFVLNPPEDSYVVKVNWSDNPWFPKELEKERKHLMKLDKVLYDHIWEGECLENQKGTYYGKQIEAAREGGRIGRVPIDPILPVSTFWDLGIADATAIWMVQQAGTELRVISYYENSGEGLQHYINHLHDFRDKHSITFKDHFAPHDIQVRELTSGKTRKDQARQMGIVFRVTPNIPIMDGIEAARRIFPRCYFDEKRCADGLRALSYYRCEYDEDKRVFKDRPLHDWSSHGGDSWRYFAVAWRDKKEMGLNTQAVMKQEWSVF
jgi:phage terminase large subunit